jgi:glycine/D-amino acid oxidase-like deaminating enzyme
MPPPYNAIMIGGGRPYLAHRPEQCMLRDDDDKQMEGIAEFFRSWPATDVQGWGADGPELERAVDEGGCWTGGEFLDFCPEVLRKLKSLIQDAVETSSADMFPFVGAVPDHDGQWIAAGFAGHGKFFC